MITSYVVFMNHLISNIKPQCLCTNTHTHITITLISSIGEFDWKFHDKFKREKRYTCSIFKKILNERNKSVTIKQYNY